MLSNEKHLAISRNSFKDDYISSIFHFDLAFHSTTTIYLMNWNWSSSGATMMNRIFEIKLGNQAKFYRIENFDILFS